MPVAQTGRAAGERKPKSLGMEPEALARLQTEGRDRFEAEFDVSRETLAALDRYVTLLTEWQTRMNLVATSTLGAVWQRHIADSMHLIALVPRFETAADLGSGGGLPGIVMAIVRPASRVHLIESVGKKATFLRAVADDLGLNTHVHARRIETCGQALAQSDIITARALASLDTLCGLVAPHLKPGARCFFSKGANHDAEMETARAHWSFEVKQHASPLSEGSVILEIAGIKRRRRA
ncbi:16S rRNA (guanine(527)-N(7))-methyltransferase RsmG [Fulvimarina sp. 2208YS6-2-32]|uniref:Ribosomal RNA small subunit methyltransferase G n=1 Tax=Fulvimarina uroteuthidis TaxID=3098149 RepID=A0ABU5I0V6_9HYPH|nr:16S rRNA (guanine(527)-N(7))-methyltransferase RsmG [Fulvimarina sp. 2208YS6-2-32]MDY8109022.1 16S rRNA (guanine(527)-N(7))-methyltransferase RsmG [Fulvimarina sp. 2208YS6-2-32]